MCTSYISLNILKIFELPFQKIISDDTYIYLFKSDPGNPSLSSNCMLIGVRFNTSHKPDLNPSKENSCEFPSYNLPDSHINPPFML